MSPTLDTEDEEDVAPPLSRDDLENYLRSLDKAALKFFLQKAKI